MPIISEIQATTPLTKIFPSYQQPATRYVSSKKGTKGSCADQQTERRRRAETPPLRPQRPCSPPAPGLLQQATIRSLQSAGLIALPVSQNRKKQDVSYQDSCFTKTGKKSPIMSQLMSCRGFAPDCINSSIPRNNAAKI